MRAALASLLVIAATADAAPDAVLVEIGKTVARDVGAAIGYQCDDPSLISAELKTMSVEGRPATNVFVVTGVRAGKTLCRVGLDYSRPSVVFEVRVAPVAPVGRR
jgi:hypothetical protein